MVAQGAQAEFHGQKIPKKKRARHLSFNVIRNLENFVGICCAYKWPRWKETARQKDFRGRTGRAEDERRKMAKKCGPLTHSSSAPLLRSGRLNSFSPLKSEGKS